MNPKLSLLQPYPFERLRQLFAGVTTNPAYRAISLGIGEPKHAAPQMLKDALAAALDTGLTGYPATAGEPALREACAAWLQRRYGVTVSPANLTTISPPSFHPSPAHRRALTHPMLALSTTGKARPSAKQDCNSTRAAATQLGGSLSTSCCT